MSSAFVYIPILIVSMSSGAVARGEFPEDAYPTYDACMLQAEADAQPSASDVARLARAMRDAKGRYVLVTEPQFPARIVEMLVRETGAPAIALDPLASGPASPEPGRYAKVMEKNIETLRGILAS